MHDADAYRGSTPHDIFSATSQRVGSPSRRTLLIAADVDGTLVDGNGCAALSRDGLRDAFATLSALHDARVGLALASSRTIRELLVLQRALGQRGPCIGEDGAMLALDTSDQRSELSRARSHALSREHSSNVIAAGLVAGARQMRVWRIADSASMLRRELGELIAQHELDPRDSGAMRELGFRSAAAVRRAIVEREASILLDLANASDAKREGLLQGAAQVGAHVHCGGRWHTVTRGAGKGNALALLRALMSTPDAPRFAARNAPRASARAGNQRAADGDDLVIVGIGNEENDETLLQGADVRFAINNPGRGVHPRLARVDGVMPLASEGTRGFVEMLQRLEAVTLFPVRRA